MITPEALKTVHDAAEIVVKSMVADYCCEAFTAEAHFCSVEKVDGLWNVLGCCKNCNVLEGMKFCPFCGRWGMTPHPPAT